MSASQLKLDMATAPPRWPRLGLWLLAAGVASLMAALFVAEHTARRLGDASAAVDEQSGQLRASRKKPSTRLPASPEEAKSQRAMQLMQRDLSTPWERMLGALEACQGPDVALLVIEPSVANRTVRLQLEARNVEAMLAYLRSLQAEPRVASAMLVSHEALRDARTPVVRFQMQVDWGAR